MKIQSQPYFNSGVDETAVLVKTGQVALTSLDVNNPNTVQVYIQLFNAAAASDVAVGMTTPKLSYLIGAGDGTNSAARYFDLQAEPVNFNKGLVIAVTTGAADNGAPTSNCPVNATYY